MTSFVRPPDAHIFRPSEAEFENPFSYFEKIKWAGERYGIIKIIPPDNWKPTNLINKNTFKFNPRKQDLSKLEAHSRMVKILVAKMKILHDLNIGYNFDQIKKLNTDLYNLQCNVDKIGYFKIYNWNDTNKLFNKDEPLYSAKNIYETFLLPLKIIENLNFKNLSIKKRRNIKHSIESTSIKDLQNVKIPIKRYKMDDLHCCQFSFEVFGNLSDFDENIVHCPDCLYEYHLGCLFWKNVSQCPYCIHIKYCKMFRQDDMIYSFVMSEKEYNLSLFKRKANEFKKKIFPRHGIPSSEQMEKAYWNILLNDPNEYIVEYGADLKIGINCKSGFPILANAKSLEEKKYAVHPWNLNNISVNDQCMLKFVDTEISGMITPWLYVGMCFSTFCWHTEDHWTNSINYNHTGAIKRWYGIPGSHAVKFENCLYSIAPELKDMSPDIVHHITTMINPTFLMNSGVEVYGIDQKCGEFVITFPRAYHGGFNQGFNVAEAVNFCDVSWLHMGKRCIDNYKILKRKNIFCYELLVTNIVEQCCSGKNVVDSHIARYVALFFKELVSQRREIYLEIKQQIVKKNKRNMYPEYKDNLNMCCICKTYIFLLGVECDKCNRKKDEKNFKLACHLHYTDMCSCEMIFKKVVYRYTEYELNNMVDILEDLFINHLDDGEKIHLENIATYPIFLEPICMTDLNADLNCSIDSLFKYFEKRLEMKTLLNSSEINPETILKYYQTNCIPFSKIAEFNQTNLKMNYHKLFHYRNTELMSINIDYNTLNKMTFTEDLESFKMLNFIKAVQNLIISDAANTLIQCFSKKMWIDNVKNTMNNSCTLDDLLALKLFSVNISEKETDQVCKLKTLIHETISFCKEIENQCKMCLDLNYDDEKIENIIKKIESNIYYNPHIIIDSYCTLKDRIDYIKIISVKRVNK
ncbi:Jumonji/ARID domain-containing protein 2 [Intoshia linei]|uniref:Jumonji/ARID domain-containing protein 2 n=1 Tax=Intoshia linei TaxID=1819745 RepID=A0A177B3S3_9BILA|nr:Jumonji/ARID domain-containing protein 2 [Intoshia linei]